MARGSISAALLLAAVSCGLLATAYAGANGYCTQSTDTFDAIVRKFREDDFTISPPGPTNNDYGSMMRNKIILLVFGSSQHPDRVVQYKSLLRVQSFFNWQDFLTIHVPMSYTDSTGEIYDSWQSVTSALASQNFYLSFPTTNRDLGGSGTIRNSVNTYCPDSIRLTTGEVTNSVVIPFGKVLLDRNGRTYRRYHYTTTAEEIMVDVLALGVTRGAAPIP